MALPTASPRQIHWLVIVLLTSLTVCHQQAEAQYLQAQLSSEDPAALAKAAREQGDATRGAIVFYQPFLSCTQCHTSEAGSRQLGPDLTKMEKNVTDVYLVESILNPSKHIKKGFKTVSIITMEGKPLMGLLAEERDDALVLRDPAENGRLITISKADIDERIDNGPSIMPAGLVNGLASRLQFLDLMRYLMEIAAGGSQRALQLKPSPSLYAARPLPEYESDIDHAGMISNLDQESFQRGEAIYNRLCINCHGTHDRPGSLPASLRFASGKFKSGSDPYTMYQTLTKGFGMMVQQTWMVPQQKYDAIHYLREEYLKDDNPSEYFEVSPAYLDQLPQGATRGPEPSNILPWEQMDYGPNLVATYEIGSDGSNFAYKGNAIRLDDGPGGVSQGRNWMVYDYDTLRVAAAWSGAGFIDWQGINFDGEHAVHPRVVGHVHFSNPTGPGWGNPSDGSFTDDQRVVGRDGRIYGPLPRSWARYKGMYYHGDQTIVSYTVGTTDVLELPGLAGDDSAPVFTRTFNIGPRDREMVLQVAHHPPGTAPQPVAGIVGNVPGAEWISTDEGNLRLRISSGRAPLKFTLWITPLASAQALRSAPMLDNPTADISFLLTGGPRRWPDVLKTTATLGNDDGPFAVDVLAHPADNPRFCRMRLTGFDFFPDGDRAAICTWDGSVWLVRGLSKLSGRGEPRTTAVELTWQRIASGLFQPLGLKIVNGEMYVSCRDQLCVLHDLNGDGEIDYFENFNNDHQVTDHFHEFAMGLQVDDEGNFYYAKSARHALAAVVPHHGTLLRVSKDGSRTDILATGFRAANGICLNPDGTFIVTDQEGHWNPKNRINWVRPGEFFGNMFGYHDVTDSSDEAMQQPLCWITNEFDRSPSELLWVDSPRWGPLRHSLLNFSYGYGKIYIVPHEQVAGQMQGGMCELPLSQFPTGVMRGRFHPQDGQLYTCGMFAWGSNQAEPGGFYRVRYTGKPVHLPVGLAATTEGLSITFSGDLDREAAGEPSNYAMKVWSLRRTADYGSEHYDERNLEVAGAAVASDGKTVKLTIPNISPTWCMEIKYAIQGANGLPVNGTIHNTIHNLR